MNVTFYKNFSKRKNSTLRPTGGTDLTCYLKDDCSVLNPVFLIDGIDLGYNYCKFNDRYYFITDITLNNNNIYEISCSVDVLATYKTDIGSLTTFIERSASNYDNMLTDNSMAASTAITMNESTISLGAVNKKDKYTVLVHSDAGVILYVFDSLRDAACFYNAGQTWSALGRNMTTQDFFDSLKNSGFGFVGNDVTNYMSDLLFIPYLPDDAGAQDLYVVTNEVRYGFTSKTSHDQIILLNPKYYYQNFSVTLTDPGNIYTDYRARDSRFSEYRIYLPGCGEFVLPANEAGCKDLIADVSMDFTSSAISYKIKHSNGTEVGLYEGHFGTLVPVMGTRIDMFGMAQDAISTIGSALNYNVVSEANSGISLIQKAAEPTVISKQSASGNAAQAKHFQDIIYSIKNYNSKDFPTAVAGRPIHSNLSINTLSGFVKCGNASVAISGFDSEREQVNNYLNSGFYYE